MGKKVIHPDKELLDYVSGSLDQTARSAVEQHLESCGECSHFASVVKALRQEAQGPSASRPESNVIRARGVNLSSAPGLELPDRPASAAGCSESANSFAPLAAPPRIDPYAKPDLPGLPPAVGSADSTEETLMAHPTAEELASLFYGRPAKNVGPAARMPVVAHVAICGECAGILGEYSRAETASANLELQEAAQREAPAWVFKKIDEWEQSAFGRPKPAEEIISQTTLNKLLAIVQSEGRGLQESMRKHLTRTPDTAVRPGFVPVIVLGREGKARGVEMFRLLPGQSGEQKLEPERRSAQFDGRRLVAVRCAASADPEFSVAVVRQSCASFRREGAEPGAESAHYFLVEE
ncbi:MAG TPA: zf-HC2 domain-containing protein [Blastocatellia bacterium]|nr:zf-HC2 domain-containing protein [Blastocatellia bacterium]